MQNNPIYQQFKIDTADYTDRQINDATKSQAAILLSVAESAIGDKFLNNMKRRLLKDRRIVQDDADKKFFVDQFSGDKRVAVKEKWPESVVTQQEISGKRAFVFWPDGAPEDF